MKISPEGDDRDWTKLQILNLLGKKNNTQIVVIEFPKPAHLFCGGLWKCWPLVWRILVRSSFALILLPLSSSIFCATEFLQTCSWMGSAPRVFVSALGCCWFPVPPSTRLLLLCHSSCLRNSWNFAGPKELKEAVFPPPQSSKYCIDTLPSLLFTESTICSRKS